MLAVVGAGPKGIAIAAKARALAVAGCQGTRVVLVNRGEVRGELDRAPGYAGGLLPAGDAAGEGCRLSVHRELGRGVGRRGRGDGGVQLAAPPDQARCLQRLGRPAACGRRTGSWSAYLREVAELAGGRDSSPM